MKKIFISLFLSLVLIAGAASAEAASIWSKYVAADKSFSFHYPSGWKVENSDSIVVIEKSKSEEQLVMAMLPHDPSKSSKTLAKEFLIQLKEGNPNIRALNWRGLDEGADDQIIFDLTDKINGKKYSGLGMVIKSKEQAIWFSYFAPITDYYQIRAFNILQGFIGSLATGSTSTAPEINYNVKVANRIDKNAKAFLFVLEFTLGAPFTQSQEATILKELKEGWRFLSEEELTIYDQYPVYVKGIMKMKQKDLEKLRVELEAGIEDWLEETDQSDSIVMLIKSSLKNRGKIVIKGKVPLTEMSLTAYSEIIAYSRLLQEDFKALPDQISKKTVKEIKKEVKKAWKSFSTDDKKDIATSPGLWVCLRTQLKYGTKTEKKSIRNNLIKLEKVTRDIKTISSTETNSSGSGSGTKKPMDMTAHWSMMQIQQQTFNSYMWSRGFNYLPATGKMW